MPTYPTGTLFDPHPTSDFVILGINITSNTNIDDSNSTVLGNTANFDYQFQLVSNNYTLNDVHNVLPFTVKYIFKSTPISGQTVGQFNHWIKGAIGSVSFDGYYVIIQNIDLSSTSNINEIFVNKPLRYDANLRLINSGNITLETMYDIVITNDIVIATLSAPNILINNTAYLIPVGDNAISTVLPPDIKTWIELSCEEIFSSSVGTTVYSKNGVNNNNEILETLYSGLLTPIINTLINLATAEITTIEALTTSVLFNGNLVLTKTLYDHALILLIKEANAIVLNGNTANTYNNNVLIYGSITNNVYSIVSTATLDNSKPLQLLLLSNIGYLNNILNKYQTILSYILTNINSTVTILNAMFYQDMFLILYKLFHIYKEYMSSLLTSSSVITTLYDLDYTVFQNNYNTIYNNIATHDSIKTALAMINTYSNYSNFNDLLKYCAIVNNDTTLTFNSLEPMINNFNIVKDFVVISGNEYTNSLAVSWYLLQQLLQYSIIIKPTSTIVSPTPILADLVTIRIMFAFNVKFQFKSTDFTNSYLVC